MQNCCAGTMSVIVVFARSGRLNNRTINLERSDAVGEELTKLFCFNESFPLGFHSFILVPLNLCYACVTECWLCILQQITGKTYRYQKFIFPKL